MTGLWAQKHLAALQVRSDKKQDGINAMKNAVYAFIKAGAREEFVQRAFDGFSGRVPMERIDSFVVSDLFAVPNVAMDLARTGDYKVVVAAGYVEEDPAWQHSHFLSQSVTNGLMRVGLDTGVLVLSILACPKVAPENAQQHQVMLEHFHAKGRQAADAVLQISKLKASLPALRQFLERLWPV